MAENYHDDGAMDWDDEISQDSKPFEALPAGDYDFVVVKCEKEKYTPREDSKIPTCKWKAATTLRIKHPDNGKDVDVNYNLFLHRNCEGMLCDFFRGIGQRKHGDPLRPDWSTVVGSRGRCKIKVREYDRDDGSKGKSNDVARFHDPPGAGLAGAHYQSAPNPLFEEGEEF